MNERTYGAHIYVLCRVRQIYENYLGISFVEEHHYKNTSVNKSLYNILKFMGTFQIKTPFSVNVTLLKSNRTSKTKLVLSSKLKEILS